MDNTIINIINESLKEIGKIRENSYGFKENFIDEGIKIAGICLKNIKKFIDNIYRINNIEYKNEILELKAFEMLIDELGYRYSKEMFNDQTIGKYKADVKSRLFMIFVKTLNEIIYLLKGGYAVGAMARIRYIYEIAVFMEIINNNDNEFAKQYFEASEKTRYEMRKELNKYNNLNGYKQKFNYKKFNGDYAWAQSIVKQKQNTKITFYDLANISSYKSYYSLYKQSCWYVHADMYGSLASLDKSENEEISTWITTPSKYGTDKVLIYLLVGMGICKDYFINIESPVSFLALSATIYTNKILESLSKNI
ncbi:DUF5677 domain-containing protein [Clostridium cadaveris]|uniref:DUF5677 domain-containing protein n=1 Tax=Clostridium cadaveris TaxID=1529 RepID=UPI0015B50F4A|nr:DUF5677 domain-containing protein [Clostridium cadaveris]NWK10416.1 hypothetical protein [Clostridium cadaveris]